MFSNVIYNTYRSYSIKMSMSGTSCICIHTIFDLLTNAFSLCPFFHPTLMSMHVWITCSYTYHLHCPMGPFGLVHSSRLTLRPRCHISALLLPPHSPPLNCGGGNAEGAVLDMQARQGASRFQTRTVPKEERFSPSPCTSQTCLLSWMKMATWASLTCLSWTSCLRVSNTSCPSSHHLLCPVSSSSSSSCCLPLSLYPTHLHSPSRWHCASAIWSPRRRHSPPRLPTAFRTVQMTRCVRERMWPFKLASCLFVLFFFLIIRVTRCHLHIPQLFMHLHAWEREKVWVACWATEISSYIIIKGWKWARVLKGLSKVGTACGLSTANRHQQENQDCLNT